MSEQIIVAEYQGYKKINDSVDYFTGVKAQYKIIRVIKSGSLKINDLYEIKFGFGFSACSAPTDWRFSEALMPAIGELQILFINQGQFYGGNFGRQKYTQELYKQIINCK